MTEMLQANKVIHDLLALVPELPEEAIISRSVYRDDSIKVILFAFAQGEMLSEHTSSYPAILHFLAGKAMVTLGEAEMAAVPGTWIHMPAHLPHSIQAETPVHMLLLMLQGKDAG